jgi:hypothetical protein
LPTNREFLRSGAARIPRTRHRSPRVRPPAFDCPATLVGVPGTLPSCTTQRWGPRLDPCDPGAQCSGRSRVRCAQRRHNHCGRVFLMPKSLRWRMGLHIGRRSLCGRYFCEYNTESLDLEVALYIAGLSEAFMGTQNKGWGCGSSNGEGLPLLLAENSPPGDTHTGITVAIVGFRGLSRLVFENREYGQD